MQKKALSPRLLLWLAVGTVLVLSLLWLVRPQNEAGHLTAVISVDGKTVRTLDLATAGDQEFSLLEETGLPIIFQVQDHAIRFLSSDCPDKVCVNTGFLRSDLEVASCLPNRTSLFITAE
ncbi:MAG: NusG domain II-containing protein [Angelakisella sp.]|jgi:hypothetical protein|nr:NusG domain II-containing protein [Angelakisella sp.]